MENLLNKFGFIITVIWVGSLWSMLMVTSILFNKIPSTYIAGAIAADMFQFLNYFGMFVLITIILIGIKLEGIKIFKKLFFWITLLILASVLISFFGLNPLLETLKIEAIPRDVVEGIFENRYNTWHGITSIVYLFQCIMGVLLILRMR